MGHCFSNEHSIVTVPLGEDAVIFSLYYFHFFVRKSVDH